MLSVFITIAVLAFILLVSQYLWINNLVRGEYGRKLVHIFSGVFIAFWPYYLPKNVIALLAVTSLLAVIVVRNTKIVRSIHDIQRLTIGEYLYPIGMLVVLFIAKEHWIFTTALLFVALADGMAAVIGKKWGSKQNSYRVFGMHKTYEGSTAYLLFAYVAIVVGSILGGSSVMRTQPVLIFVVLPVVSALLEAVSPFGIDNLTTPLVVALVLNSLL